MSQQLQRTLNLTLRPRIVACGFALHGMRSKIEHYRLDELWSLHLYRYAGTLRMDEDTFEIRPGAVSLSAPGTRLEYRYRGPSLHLFAHFSFDGEGLHGQGAVEAGALESTMIPAMQYLTESEARFGRDFEECIGYWGTQPGRAETRLWDMLWEASDFAESNCNQTGTMWTEGERAMLNARQLIETRLSESISVENLAAEVGLSHNHLTRLFRAHAGTTVTEYIQTQRAERAAHLLRHTTLPAKAVAAQVGILDLQAFNKLLRRRLGLSPRAIRGARDI
jgi:AraC family transcriptional regulator